MLSEIFCNTTRLQATYCSALLLDNVASNDILLGNGTAFCEEALITDGVLMGDVYFLSDGVITPYQQTKRTQRSAGGWIPAWR